MSLGVARTYCLNTALLALLGSAFTAGWAIPQSRDGQGLTGASVLETSTEAHNHVTVDVEGRLLNAIHSWQSGDSDTALRHLRAITDEYPTFKLAQMIYGDMLAARAGQPGLLTRLDFADNVTLQALRDEARARLLRDNQQPPYDRIPASLLRLAPEQDHAVVVDLNRSRLYLFENDAGIPRLVADYYAGIGAKGPHKQVEGDERTPVGVYFITRRLDDKELPDLYGIAAYPVNYPNNWDDLHGRTGSGIWLHGVPSDTWSRAPRSSRGCVTLANADLAALEPHFNIGNTPVVFSDNVSWITPLEAEFELEEFNNAFEQWRLDWESRDADAYLSHYSADFRAGRMSRAAFAAHKRRVNPSKEFIEIEIDNLSVLSYTNDPVIVATFEQRYRSNNNYREARKRQYWIKDDSGRWLILTEDHLK